MLVLLVVIIFSIYKLLGFRESKGNDILVVGASLPFTGPTAQYGEYFKKGMDSVVGGNKKIKIIYEDSKGDAAGGVAAFQKLTTVDGVDILVSAISKATVPIIPLAQQSKTPIIISFVAAMNATSKNNDYAYRIFWTAEQFADFFVERIVDQKITHVALLQAKNEGAQSTADLIVPKLNSAGIKVTIETFQDTDTDFRTQLAKVKQANPQVIGIIAIPTSQWKGIMVQAKEAGINLPIYDVLGVLLNPGTPEALAGLAEKVYTMTTPFNTGEYATEFKNDYIKRNNREPAGFESFAIDIGLMLKNLADNNITTKEEVTKYLKSLNSFEGITSAYTVDDSHNFMPLPIRAQFINGKISKSEK
ncbi:MAG: Leucine, isoleucine, valine-, threonine-, and alanine-binding protein [Candidatus Nomurabacteria bacterium]|nr:Leucine, isoleucine, valine-, threonine-, and alanine-binding protein [Candidatus Nomurabacteria bacterium]